MRIDFFEEFPSEETINKAKLIAFNSTIYLAAKSLEEFKELAKNIAAANPQLELAYWPIMEKSYWISPFSYQKELERLREELIILRNAGDKIKVLLDLELPIHHKKAFLVNIFNFSKNKTLIKKIFADLAGSNIELLTAEYSFQNLFTKNIFQFLGISYEEKICPHKKIVMLYSSKRNKFIFNFLKKNAARNNYKSAAIGLLAKGINKSDKIITPDNLNKDLEFLQKNNIPNAVIFRLNGLNENYLEIINRYL
jgi:hypothetical protein